jgi:hypothetical protein
MLEDVKKQSGVCWDERRYMIQVDPPIWDNIIKVSFLSVVVCFRASCRLKITCI